MLKGPLRFLIDCDGVVFQNHLLWHEKYNNTYPEKPLFLGDITSWDKWKHTLGEGDLVKGWERMQKALLTPDMYLRSKFYPNATKVLVDIREHGNFITFVSNIPNSANNVIRQTRLRSLFGYCEKIVYRWENKSCSQKSDRHVIDADIFIDDYLPSCIKWANLHPDGEAWVFAQPWNVLLQNDATVPKNVKWVWGWEDIAMRINHTMNGEIVINI